VHHLIDCVLGDVEPHYTGEVGVHAVHCTLAQYDLPGEDAPSGSRR